MFESFFQYIKNHTSIPLTIQEEEIIKSCCVPKKIRKHQFFLQEGEVCTHVAFILKGSMRQYSVDDKGVEHIVNLFLENWFVSDRESNVKQTPSAYFIDAYENTEVLLFSREDVVNKIMLIPAIVNALQEIDNRHAIAMQNRVNTAISLSAEQRYQQLVKTYPAFLQRFPQHIIASYLGITKETLSRVRNQITKK